MKPIPDDQLRFLKLAREIHAPAPEGTPTDDDPELKITINPDRLRYYKVAEGVVFRQWNGLTNTGQQCRLFVLEIQPTLPDLTERFPKIEGVKVSYGEGDEFGRKVMRDHQEP